MENIEKSISTFENSIAVMEAEHRKARIVSDILKKAEQGDEEENKGRS